LKHHLNQCITITKKLHTSLSSQPRLPHNRQATRREDDDGFEDTTVTSTHQDGFSAAAAYTNINIHTRFLFSRPIFPELFQDRLLQVQPVPKSELLGYDVAELLHARRPSRRPTNSIEAHKYQQHITDLI